METKEIVNFMREFLGNGFILVDSVGKGQLGMIIFLKRRDAVFLSQVNKNYITRDKVRIVSLGYKGGVMI